MSASMFSIDDSLTEARFYCESGEGGVLQRVFEWDGMKLCEAFYRMQMWVALNWE